jgi:hypothetical protein
MLGGFRTLLHDEVAYVYFQFMQEAGFKDLKLEPRLQPLTGETLKYKTGITQDEAKSDIRTIGFWTRSRRAYFDITAFSPYKRSGSTKSMKSLFRLAEQKKKCNYQDRIANVEHADFTPLVFSTSGGMGPQAEVVTKRLGQLIAEKSDMPFSVVAGWMRCKVSFSLLRSSLVCLRGTRSYKPKNYTPEAQICLAVSQARMKL